MTLNMLSFTALVLLSALSEYFAYRVLYCKQKLVHLSISDGRSQSLCQFFRIGVGTAATVAPVGGVMGGKGCGMYMPGCTVVSNNR
jgi:hypothetical protein